VQSVAEVGRAQTVYNFEHLAANAIGIIRAEGHSENKMSAKSKMASKTYVSVFLLSNAQCLPDFIILFCIRSVFSVSNFCGRNFFPEIKMADWFKMASFLGKNRLFLSGSAHRKLSFFISICKNQFVVHRPKIYQKKSKWRRFLRWRLHFFVV
jgi:hypothetical protein